MNWSYIIDVIATHRCDERRRYGKCNCRTGKGAKAYNPCQVTQETMKLAEQLMDGELIVGGTEAITKFLRKKTCSLSKTGRCNHRGCIVKETAQEMLHEHEHRKAA